MKRRGMEEEEEMDGLAVRSVELDAADLLDPNPDIVGLFCHYNDTYFDSKLQACTVEWSTSRMTLCAGICKYAEGSCAIRLSEPLLKFRSSADVKETLLHEMIHAYLWLTNSNKDHDDHGPCFQKMLQAINESQAVDHQRPTGGYHISIYHNFSDEVNSYRKHHWKCISCGDVIKRATNRAPSQADCYQKSVTCSNKRCHWHRHQQLCRGEYEKIAEPEGYQDRRSRTHRSVVQLKESKASSEVNKETLENLEDDIPGRLPKNASLDMYFRPQSKCREEPLMGTEIRDHCCPHGHILSKEEFSDKLAKKRMRKNKSNDSDGDDICSVVDGRHAVTESKDSIAQMNECTVIIGWKGWYAFEGDKNDERDTEALKNKRSQRRMFERTSSRVVNTSEVVIGVDSPGVIEMKDPVSSNRGFVESDEDKAVGENVLSTSLFVSKNFVTDVVGANDSNLSRQILPVDDYSSSVSAVICTASQAINFDTVEHGINECFVMRNLQVGALSDSTSRHEDSSARVSIHQESLASFTNEQTTLMDHGDCAIVVPFDMAENLPVTFNRGDQPMKVKSEKCHEAEDSATMDKVAGVSEVKAPCKGRAKRQRDDYERANVVLPKQEPSAVCPICQKILLGNIEDVSFNTKFNQHIDACMSAMNESCLQ